MSVIFTALLTNSFCSNTVLELAMKHSYFADSRNFTRKALNNKPMNTSDYINYSMHYYVMQLKQLKEAGLNHCLELK